MGAKVLVVLDGVGWIMSTVFFVVEARMGEADDGARLISRDV